MKDKMKSYLLDKRFHYFAIFFFSCIIAIPLFTLQLKLTHDGSLHILRLIGTDLSIQNTTFPHLVIPVFCDNLGYSINAFYSPIATYIPYLFTAFPIQYIDALKIFAYFTILLSGLTMYHCTYEITKKRPVALMASIIYMASPYRFEDMYIRFALAEFTTFIFIPILFQGMYNLFQGDGKKHYYITIGAVGLILTHAITTLYIAIFCLVYVLFNPKKLKEKQVWKKIGVNILFILTLSAFFWVVLLEFKTHTDYTIFDQEIMRTTNRLVYEKAINLQEFFVKGSQDINCRIGIFNILAFMIRTFLLEQDKRTKNISNLFFFCYFFSLTLYKIVSMEVCTRPILCYPISMENARRIYLF